MGTDDENRENSFLERLADLAREAGLPTEAEANSVATRRRVLDVYPKAGKNWGGLYEVVGLLNAGAFGATYLVRNCGQLRVLKLLHPSVLGEERVLSSFLLEMDVLSAVHGWEPHPEIVSFHTRGEIDRVPYIELGYLAGETLDAYIRAHNPADLKAPGWNAGEFLKRLRHIAVALKILHELGVVHRDVKPSNIMVVPSNRGEERMVLLDFGAAYAPETITATEEVAYLRGTVGYIAPEQARCEPVDGRTDIWSFGAVMLRYLRGRSPHSTSGPCTEGELVDRAKRNEVYLPAALESEPCEVTELMSRALEAEPGKRFQSADELIVAIDSAITACDAFYTRREAERLQYLARKRVLRTLHLIAALALLACITR